MPKKKQSHLDYPEIQTDEFGAVQDDTTYTKVYNHLYADLDEAEEMELFNPSGVTRPVFYD